MGSAFGFLTRYFSVLHFCILRHQAAAATLSAGPLGEVSVWEIRSSSALENPEATPCPGMCRETRHQMSPWQRLQWRQKERELPVQGMRPVSDEPGLHWTASVLLPKQMPHKVFRKLSPPK